MPIVRVEVWKGRPQEVKKALADSITNAVVSTIGCKSEAVTVIVEEVNKENWFIGAKNCAELFPQI